MQTAFVLLIAIAVGLLAKKRARNGLGWGLLAAVLFVIVDTALVWLVLFSLLRGPDLNQSAVIAVGLLLKCTVFAAIFALFKANLLDERLELTSRAGTGGAPAELVRHVACPQCQRKVIPMANGTCPSCLTALPPE